MKIFVSSTYVDLVEYRKAVERAINLLEQQFVGMEYFGALSEEPKTAALDKVAQCDVFVGIYAHRYGFIPDGDSKSITEQELDRAQKLGKATFCYRVKPDQPWNPKMIEGGDAQTKLDSFLKRIDKQYLRQEFTTSDDLLAKVSADLARHLSSSGVQATIAHPLPPVPYYVHPYPLQANFTGRQSERGMLNDWFTRESQAVFVLEAIGGMGKSALAWVWAQDIFSLGAPAAGVFWWSFYEDRDLSSFLHKALSYASHGALNGKSFASDRERIDALLAQMRDKRFLFVLDGFERVLRAYARMDAAYRGDEFDADAQNEFRACTDPNAGILLRGLAMNAGLRKTLITTRLMPRELDELESVHHVKLKGLNPDDAVKFFERQRIKGTRAEIESACADYAFHPLSLRLLSGTLASDPRYKHDIKFAPRVNPLEQDKERKMLDFAYNSLPPRQQKLISQLAAFRSPLAWEIIEVIFTKDFKNDAELARTVTELLERGLLQREITTEMYELHPIVQRYCYARLTKNDNMHTRLVVYYFREVEPSISPSLHYGDRVFAVEKRIKLLPAIWRYSILARMYRSFQGRTQVSLPMGAILKLVELFHHSIESGMYGPALDLFIGVLTHVLFYDLAAYNTVIELLSTFTFDNGMQVTVPHIRRKSDKAWVLNMLANAYAFSGKLSYAEKLYLGAISLYEQQNDKSNLELSVGAIAGAIYLPQGRLIEAEKNQRRRINSAIELKRKFDEAIARRELALVWGYMGKCNDGLKELDLAFDLESKQKDAEMMLMVLVYSSWLHIINGNIHRASEDLRKAYEFINKQDESIHAGTRNGIQWAWTNGMVMLGDPFSTNDISTNGRLAKVETQLKKALSWTRASNILQFESIILLAFAKLRREQADERHKTNNGNESSQVMGHVDSVGSLMDESLAYANEALSIADRCEYRLQQAEIHNFLAEWHWQHAQLVKGDAFLPLREDLKQKAREHAEKAKERAWCDGPPYYYKVAWEEAEKTLQTISSTYSTDSS